MRFGVYNKLVMATVVHLLVSFASQIKPIVAVKHLTVMKNIITLHRYCSTI